MFGKGIWMNFTTGKNANIARTLRVSFVCGYLLTAVILLQGGTLNAAHLEDHVEYAENRFIVKVRPEIDDLQPRISGEDVLVADPVVSALNSKWTVTHVERLFAGPEPAESPELNLRGFWRFWVKTPLDRAALETALADYASAAIVESVEPVGIHRIYYNPNDPSWSSQWHLRTTAGDHDIDAPEAWDIERGDSTVILGVTDTGVLYTHSDLSANIWRNWAEKNGVPGVDDDLNGFVDDSVGWDFVSSQSGCWSGEDCSGADNNPSDFNGHGTHVAGIAAAVTNNSIGVAGIAGGGTGETGARIMPLRMGWSGSWFGQEVGYVGMDYAAQAINYGRVKGVTAFNCSWGSSNSGGIGTAVTAAINAGIIFCVAAGNDNNSSADYLSARGDCIDIAAVNSNDVKASFSNYGSWVDVSAPGVDIYATYSNHYSPTYTYLDGTSMASPCVLGQVGLLKSRNPAATRTQITIAILTNVDNIYDENPSYNGLLGSGRINLHLALLSLVSITVTNPNTAVTWYLGESQTIQWSSSGVSGNVKIEINRLYPGGAWETIVASTANDGSHPWTVAGAVSSAARIRVSAVSDPSIQDVSDTEFFIASPSIQVVSPNGGETWYTGEVRTISWTSAGFTGNVLIELNRAYSGGTWETLFASTANDGAEAWTLSGAGTTQARIRITSISQPTVTDVSNANFTIAVPYIVVGTPNGGESWTIGSNQTISWSSAGFTGNVKIEINRSYPAGSWTTLFASTANDNAETWTVTSPTTPTARIRVSSVSQPTILDISNNNFSIVGQPPVLRHDPLDDFTPGTGVVTAVAYSPQLSVSTVRMHYRPAGGGAFDSLTLSATAFPNEYASSLASIAAGSYEYFVRATDNVGTSTSVPAGAPASLYGFDVRTLCGTVLAYDDGTAEYYSWAEGADALDFAWAVKFGPVTPPYVLCGAQFAAARTKPDSAHSTVRVFVFAADGPGGTPGSVLAQIQNGSIGNDVGGVPAGTNWAQVILRDAGGGPLVINSSEFYVTVANAQVGAYEAFGRDANGTNNHRSYFFDPCEGLWFSEDDTGQSDNAYPGNRLIRAQGYSLAAPTVVINRAGDDIVLFWNNTGAPQYKIYRADTADGSYTFLASTTQTSYILTNVGSASPLRFYDVRAATE